MVFFLYVNSKDDRNKISMTEHTPTTLLEIHESSLPGFNPLVDSVHWRVALLNFDPALTPQHLSEFQRHNESEEVFVLLSGRCILFLGEGENSVRHIFAQDLEPFKLYCVQRRIWHTHVLSIDAKLLIVENQNTSRDNSPCTNVTRDQHAEILDRIHLFWGDERGGQE